MQMDREARDPFELCQELEHELGIDTYAVNWPIGCGKEFQGVMRSRWALFMLAWILNTKAEKPSSKESMSASPHPHLRPRAFPPGAASGHHEAQAVSQGNGADRPGGGRESFSFLPPWTW